MFSKNIRVSRVDLGFFNIRKNGSKKLYYVLCASIFEMLTVVFGESAMIRTQVQLCYNRFKEGPEDVYGDIRPVHLCMSTTDENIKSMKKTILDSRRIMIREVADEVGISLGSC